MKTQAMKPQTAKYGIGQIVRHRRSLFRGLVFDIDPVFADTDEWWRAIPQEVGPRKHQPSTTSSPRAIPWRRKGL